jgi:glycerol-3-phosphate acyltransferase PlsX
MGGLIKIGIDTAADEIPSITHRKKVLPYRYAVAAAVKAIKEREDIAVYIYGDRREIEETLHWFYRYYRCDKERIVVKPTMAYYNMNKELVSFSEEKVQSRHSTIFQLMKDHKDGVIDAVLSPGESGITVLAATKYLKRIKGVKPVLVTEFPQTLEQTVIVGDVGSIIAANQFDLLDLGIMANAYYRCVRDDRHPRTALLSNGTEETKGNQLVRLTAELYREYAEKLGINYVGYVEPNHLKDVDIVIADGYVGNIFLKTAEGIKKMLEQLFSEDFRRSTLPLRYLKMGSVALTYLFERKVFQRLNPDYYGGAKILGISGNVHITHGKTSEIAYYKSIMKAAELSKQHLLEQIETDIEYSRNIVKNKYASGQSP